MPKEIIKRKSTPIKKRGQVTYQRKVDRITRWYNRLLKFRKETPMKSIRINEKGDTKKIERKPLKDLDYYLGKIKKPNNWRS